LTSWKLAEALALVHFISGVRHLKCGAGEVHVPRSRYQRCGSCELLIWRSHISYVKACIGWMLGIRYS